MVEMIDLTFSEFNEAVNVKGRDVFILFYSMLNPESRIVLDFFEKSKSSNFVCYKVDFDTETKLVDLFKILKVPEALRFRSGNLEERYAGKTDDLLDYLKMVL